MPDYSKGKIYKIYCNITGETYYGSTVNTLAKRMGQHVSKAKNPNKTCTSKSIIVRDDYDYSLIENHKCINKAELHARERYWIENYECVNKEVPGRTNKEWYEANKDKILKQHKEWNDANKDKMKAYHELYRKENKEKKELYREENKEKIQAANKVYNEKNKDKIKEKEKQKVICECGCELTRGNLTRHRKSKFHQEFMESLSSANVM
mgnify:CR=1 FL=1